MARDQYPKVTWHKDRYRGATALVLGLGPSFTERVAGGDWKKPDAVRFCVGVNDVARYTGDAEYLVVLDPPKEFRKEGKWKSEREAPLHHILNHRSKHVFVSRAVSEFWERDEPGFKFTTFMPSSQPRGQKVTGWVDHRTCQLHVDLTSTYTALSLAGFLGAKRIGVLGVDLIGHPLLQHRIADINVAFQMLDRRMRGEGIETYNLSERSALTVLPSRRYEDFVGGDR